MSNPSSSFSPSSSAQPAGGSRRLGQVKTNSKLNLISPRSFKFPGEKLLKKIGSGRDKGDSSMLTLTLSTSSTTTRGRPKRHHSLDDLDDSLRRNVSFGRRKSGGKTDPRDTVVVYSDSEDDKASLWDNESESSSSPSSDSGSAPFPIAFVFAFVLLFYLRFRSFFVFGFGCASARETIGTYYLACACLCCR